MRAFGQSSQDGSGICSLISELWLLERSFCCLLYLNALSFLRDPAKRNDTVVDYRTLKCLSVGEIDLISAQGCPAAEARDRKNQKLSGK